MTILQVLTDTGRYPMTVYPWWLRVIVTIIVPIGLATTVPIQVLRGELTGWNVLILPASASLHYFSHHKYGKQGPSNIAAQVVIHKIASHLHRQEKSTGDSPALLDESTDVAQHALISL